MAPYHEQDGNWDEPPPTTEFGCGGCLALLLLVGVIGPLAVVVIRIVFSLIVNAWAWALGTPV